MNRNRRVPPKEKTNQTNKYFRLNLKGKKYSNIIFTRKKYTYENSLFSLPHFNFSKLILSSIIRRRKISKERATNFSFFTFFSKENLIPKGQNCLEKE